MNFDLDFSNFDSEGTTYLIIFILYVLLCILHLIRKRSKVIKKDISNELRHRLLNPPIDESYNPFIADISRKIFNTAPLIASKNDVSSSTSKAVEIFNYISSAFEASKYDLAINSLNSFIATSSIKDLTELNGLLTQNALYDPHFALVKLKVLSCALDTAEQKNAALAILKRSYAYSQNTVELALRMHPDPMHCHSELILLNQKEKLLLLKLHGANFHQYIADSSIAFFRYDGNDLSKIEQKLKVPTKYIGLTVRQVISQIYPDFFQN